MMKYIPPAYRRLLKFYNGKQDKSPHDLTILFALFGIMTDRVSSEKAGEKSFFARTAKNTSKRAKRAQEKVKRKLGKSDETKDEIFDRFVENFNKQQDAIQRLEKELKNYINCIKAMMNANQLFAEAVKQVYEPDWSGRETFVNLLDSIEIHWNNLFQKLEDEVLQPLTSYQAQFPDTKNRISKRSRKLVDYDRHRHHMETLKIKGGKAGEPKKLSQAEEDYNQAKSVYLQLHSDLYDELPALYDSRIPFYVSSFQSIFTAEGVFHREASKIKTQMIDMLDVLAKETSAGTYSTRRPLSVISNVSSDGENSPSEQADNFSKLDNTDNSENAQSENEEVDAGAVNVKLAEESNKSESAAPDYSTESHSDHSSPPLGDRKETPVPSRPPPAVPKRPIERPPPPNVIVAEPETNEENPQAETNTTSSVAEDAESLPRDSEPERNSEEEKTASDDTSRMLHKVIATHPYTGEDEDELTFDKGEVIQVIMYDETDDPDDGWLLGIIESTGVKGVFPQNFTKELSENEPR